LDRRSPYPTNLVGENPMMGFQETPARLSYEIRSIYRKTQPTPCTSAGTRCPEPWFLAGRCFIVPWKGVSNPVSVQDLPIRADVEGTRFRHRNAPCVSSDQ
jgi:hypothetical protein